MIYFGFKKYKTKKKKGFTLIELIAVMAIISILAIVAFPRISGYINKAKDTKVFSKAREVAMAAESYNCSTDTPIDDEECYSNFKQSLEKYDYINLKEDPVNENMKYSELQLIMNGDRNYEIIDSKVCLK